MEFLSMTRDAFLAWAKTNITQPIDKVTVSAAIIKDGPQSKQIFLIQRNADEA